MKRGFVAAAVFILLAGNGSFFQAVHGKSEKAEFVLIHGASAGAWCWFKILSQLQHSGFKATAIDLASGGKDKTSADDVTSIPQFAKPLTDYVANATGKVILVGHSLGGVSISFAMEMFPEKVVKAVYVTAIMPLNNQTAADTFPPDLFPTLLAKTVFLLNYKNGFQAAPTSLSVNKSIIIDYVAQESPIDIQILTLASLGETPYGGFFLPLMLTPERYGSVRRFYIVTGRDALLPKSYQESLIKANPVERTFYLNKADHCPFFSFPEELTSQLMYISLL